MRALLKAIKVATGEALRTTVVRAPMTLDAQAWAIKRLLPMDPWPKSLAYQQCMVNRVLKDAGPNVQAGPFKGMTCIRDAREGCLVPKLLGCYEEELFPAVEAFIEAGYDRIIDVGCASGYWLVGLALRMPKAVVHGYDINPAALKRCRRLVESNAVESRVELHGICSHEELGIQIQGETLVFMDIDGPEFELLDPLAAPKLREADIIVETHDYVNPIITQTLIKRFTPSHRIDKISSREREPDARLYPGLHALPRQHWREALAERRPCVQDWLVMRRKSV